MRLENYYLYPKEPGDDEIPIGTIPKKGMQYRACGNVYGSEKIPVGTAIITSYVVKNDGEKIVTDFGFVYELGNPHPDYVELDKMLHSGEYPILYEWMIYDKDGVTKLSGYEGPSDGGHFVIGRVVVQDGNFVVFDNGKTYFVDWFRLLLPLNLVMYSSKFKMEFFMGFKCKPVLVHNDK